MTTWTRSLAAIALLALLALSAPAAEPPAPDTAAYQALARKGISELVTEADSAIKARGGARADDAQLFLAWDAPWGTRHAHTARMPACADSAVEDTLYLSLRTGRAADRFAGFTALLEVHATGADTLGPWWHMKNKSGANAGALRVEWAATKTWAGTAQPFRSPGQGFATLENRQSEARLRIIFAVSLVDARAIAADTVYTLARVMLQHHPERKLAGCDRPVVIEWAQATLAFGPKDEPTVSRGERLVSYAGPYSLTEPFHGPRTRVWKPAKPGAAGSK